MSPDEAVASASSATRGLLKAASYREIIAGTGCEGAPARLPDDGIDIAARGADHEDPHSQGCTNGR